MQHDVEDSGLGFLVREESTLCLVDHRLGAAHTHILRYTPREAHIRAGRSFLLPQERRSLETYQIHVRTCQINRPYKI